MKIEKNNIFFIDGNSLCYRAYYAIPRLSTSKGEPANAVYGVIAMIKKIIKDYAPGGLAVAFDLPGETARHKKFAGYKENRPPMPDELSSQMERIKDVVKAYKIPIFEKQGYEADDVIATLARKVREKGIDVTIVTGDKDAFQLVDEHVKVLSPNPSGDITYDIQGVSDKFGVSPGQMVDLMALMGDASDNVPGVKGIGKVTAAKLIREYGTLESVYDNIEGVLPGSVRKKLLEEKDMAFLSRDLVKLDSEVPVGGDELVLKMEDPDMDALTAIFKEMEFTKFLKELKPRESSDVAIIVVSSEKAITELEINIKSRAKASIKIDKNEGYAAAFNEGTVFYVDTSSSSGLRVKGLEALKRILGSSEVMKIGHDIKDDMRELSHLGIEMELPIFDVMIADYLLDPSFHGYSMRDISMRHNRDFQEDLGSSDRKRVKGEVVMDFARPHDNKKACLICEAALRLSDPISKELKDKQLDKLFFDVEMPLVRVLSAMELSGVGIDIDHLRAGSGKIEAELKNIELSAYELSGERFNINSPKQIQEILYEKLSLPTGKKIKTGRSTDEEALSKLSLLHELPKKILEYRQLSKLKTGYYDSILNFTDESTGILTAKFNQAVTATGRLSSSEPNLQNIPIKTEVGREIRSAFRPKKKDNILVAADYSQVELRVLAHLSGDKTLIGAFKDEKDVHTFTASLIFGCGVDDVTNEMRSAAKTVNFGIIYGMGAFGLAKALDISQETADRFIEAYFERYRGVKDFIDAVIEKTRKTGYVNTLFGRRRYLREITSLNDKVRSFAERAAVNTVVQGTAADIIKMAMIKCGQHFAGGNTEMLIQVHDELVFEVPFKDLGAAVGDIKNMMEGIVDLKVPLMVNIEAGPNWRDMDAI